MITIGYVHATLDDHKKVALGYSYQHTRVLPP